MEFSYYAIVCFIAFVKFIVNNKFFFSSFLIGIPLFYIYYTTYILILHKIYYWIFKIVDQLKVETDVITNETIRLFFGHFTTVFEFQVHEYSFKYKIVNLQSNLLEDRIMDVIIFI